jgi:hypothetical protein
MTMFESRKRLMQRIWAADMALYWASIGDWHYLANHIANDGAISPEMRDFFAKVLRQETKRPINRPPRGDRLFSTIRIMAEREEQSREIIINEIVEKTGLNRRTAERRYRAIHEYKDRALEKLKNLPNFCVPIGDGEPYERFRYVIDPTALSQHFMS